MNENWIEIIEILRNTLNDNYHKSEIANAVENCLRILGWRRTNGSLLKDYTLSNNSTVDIVLSKNDKENSAKSYYMPVFVEDKNSGIKIETIDFAMNDLSSDAVLSIGRSIMFFYRNNQNVICKNEILFEEDNQEGETITDLLSFQNFNKYLVNDYIVSLNEKNEIYAKSRKEIKSILNDKTILKSVFSDYLGQRGYDKKLVEEEMENIEIYARPIQSCLINKDIHAERKDTTRFSFNGSQFYPKKRFVLAVVKQYIKDHPNVTYSELEKVFPSRIISKQRGVIRPLTLVQEWMKNNSDLSSRYFLAADEIITLNDGLKYTVYNQWGLKHFNKFLQIAQSMYVVNSDKENDDSKESTIEYFNESVLQISKESFQSFVKKKN